MASIRSLKKDINFLASEMVSQAYLSKMLFKTMDNEGLSQFINKAIEFQRSFIEKVNHPDAKNNPRMLKAYFAKIRKDMITNFDEIVSYINKAS